MPVVEENIYFDTDKLIEGSTAKLTYKGILAQNGAEEIYIHYGFGLLWENLQEIKLDKTADGTFEAQINMCSSEEVTIAKVEPTSIDVPRLKKSYIIAKKIRITFYKIVTFIPRVMNGTWKKKKSSAN